MNRFTTAMTAVAGAATLATSHPALAHVPYVETADYSDSQPFEVKRIAQSKAFYGWIYDRGDVDFFRMRIDEPTRIYMHMNIPFCSEYQDWSVTYALVGPGLPEPDVALPVDLPDGYGAIVRRDEQRSAVDRPIMYEPFSARLYWEGPEHRVRVEQPGEYTMIIWQEDGAPGDYVAVIGEKEQFGPADIVRAIRWTPQIRAQKELHVECGDIGAEAVASN